MLRVLATTVALVLVAACGSEQGADKERGAAESSDLGERLIAAKAQFDELVADLEVSIDDQLLIGPRINISDFSEYEAKHEYVIVTMTVTNNSPHDLDVEAWPFNPLSIYIEDADGVQHEPDTLLSRWEVDEWAIDFLGIPAADIIRAGNTGRVVRVFDLDPSIPDPMLRMDALDLAMPLDPRRVQVAD